MRLPGNIIIKPAGKSLKKYIGNSLLLLDVESESRPCPGLESNLLAFEPDVNSVQNNHKIKPLK